MTRRIIANRPLVERPRWIGTDCGLPRRHQLRNPFGLFVFSCFRGVPAVL